MMNYRKAERDKAAVRAREGQGEGEVKGTVRVYVCAWGRGVRMAQTGGSDEIRKGREKKRGERGGEEGRGGEKKTKRSKGKERKG